MPHYALAHPDHDDTTRPHLALGRHQQGLSFDAESDVVAMFLGSELLRLSGMRLWRQLDQDSWTVLSECDTLLSMDPALHTPSAMHPVQTS